MNTHRNTPTTTGLRASRLLVPAAAALLLAACATTSRQPARDGYVRYRCADGQEIGVTYQQKGNRALVETGGWSHLLPLVPAASGAKYSDGKVTFWSKGTTAFMEEGGAVTRKDCKEFRGK